MTLVQKEVKAVYKWTVKVRPVQELPFTPWANTILYAPLTSNANDQSWNWNNLTADNSFTYSSSGCYMETANHTWLLTPFNITSGWTWTISFWRKWTPYWSEDQRDIDIYFWSGKRFAWAWFYRQNNTWNCMIGSAWTQNWTLTSNTWQLCTITIDTNSIKVYLNGGLSFTWTISSGTSSYFRFGNEYNLWADRHWRGYMKDIIVENKTWSSTEVNDYYESIKSSYGH